MFGNTDDSIARSTQFARQVSRSRSVPGYLASYSAYSVQSDTLTHPQAIKRHLSHFSPSLSPS